MKKKITKTHFHYFFIFLFYFSSQLYPCFYFKKMNSFFSYLSIIFY